MITLTVLLVLTSFILTIMHAVKGWPLWIPVLLLVILELLHTVPR